YFDEDGILAARLTVRNGEPLDNVFKLGVAGFTTDQAMSIQDAGAMAAFCNSMRANFANFLTTDDALAARHAVLLRRTAYFNFSSLRTWRQTAACETQTDVSRLKVLNPAFEIPADLARVDSDNRSALVSARGAQRVSPALAAATREKIAAI